MVQAQKSLRELELQPRAETVPPSEALVKAAEATSRQQKDSTIAPRGSLRRERPRKRH